MRSLPDKGERTGGVEATLDLRDLLNAILTCVTAGPGLGFNRAVLFLANDEHTQLEAAMAIGPATPEEAHATWERLAGEHKSLDELLLEGARSKSGFQALVEGLTVPLDAAAAGAGGGAQPEVSSSAAAHTNPLLDAYCNRHVVKIAGPASVHGFSSPLRDVFSGTEVICVPLIAKDHSLGLIVADNAFSGAPINQERVQLLQLLALLAGMALDNARIYRQVEQQATLLRDALEGLHAAQGQLIHRERLATVGAVVARVSHEIRNPLTTIGGFARTLTVHPDDVERVARNARIIVEEVEKLEALLKEMLDFTSPKPPAFEPTDINTVISALANVHREEATQRNVTLALELAPRLPAVMADRNQLHRVFLNLWQNALQAMEDLPIERPRKLTIQTWPNHLTVKIAFSDTGTGVPRDVLPNIFTPFFTTKQHGTGLGLAVAKKVVDDHGGAIHVLSEREAGTTLVISLPVGS
jgi:signal transduction histidine kinase